MFSLEIVELIFSILIFFLSLFSNTFTFKCMIIFIMTISNALINFKIDLVNVWHIKTVFFNNGYLVFIQYIIHLSRVNLLK